MSFDCVLNKRLCFQDGAIENTELKKDDSPSDEQEQARQVEMISKKVLDVLNHDGKEKLLDSANAAEKNVDNGEAVQDESKTVKTENNEKKPNSRDLKSLSSE